MKTSAFTLALLAGAALAGAAMAQPSGGPDAKGNAPLKPAHTVNDGMAKHGANSFTEAQARQHIEKSGFNGVTGLAKGQDGVWRGQAMRDGRTLDVAMDFKGNVSTPGAPPARASNTAVAGRAAKTMGPAPMADTRASTTTTATTEGAMAGGAPAVHHSAMRHHRRMHHGRRARCAAAMQAGAACSGVDKNDNGVSDKEDRMHGAATPQ